MPIHKDRTRSGDSRNRGEGEHRERVLNDDSCPWKWSRQLSAPVAAEHERMTPVVDKFQYPALTSCRVAETCPSCQRAPQGVLVTTGVHRFPAW